MGPNDSSQELQNDIAQMYSRGAEDDKEEDDGEEDEEGENEEENQGAEDD